MKANQACHPAATMCRLLEVSKSGYYAWRERPLSRRAVEGIALTAKMEAIHRRSRGTYGSPRVHAQLCADGVHVSRKRVARLMRSAGLQGVSRRRFVTTTLRDRDARPAPDLVKRNFQALASDRLWVADITYIPTWAGFLYLAIVLDAFSRRVVGWALEAHLRTELVLMALDMAFAQRSPEEVIHHSDQGTQYTSIAFGSRCREMGVRPSMDRWVIASTMPWRKASSPAWNANCWPNTGSKLRPKPKWPCSNTSKGSIIHTGSTLLSATYHQSISKGGTLPRTA